MEKLIESEGNTAFRLTEPERVPLVFHIDNKSMPQEVENVVYGIKKLAESLLFHWKAFPIILPPPLTNIDKGNDKSPINLKDLFVAPSFDELEQVATDGFGELKKLNEAQLKSIWEKGEFDVPSVNFPGQSHRWKLTQLLQKGSQNAQSSLLDNSAVALGLLIVTAKKRFISRFFSLSESLKSWSKGMWKLLDMLFGMPCTSPGALNSKIRLEHQRYLVAELNVKSSFRQSFSKFCQFIKEASRLSSREKQKLSELQPPPIPYVYQTPKGMDIDLRLFNKDLINNCLPVLSNILEREAKGWFVNFRQKLLLEMKGQGLLNDEISKRVNEAVKKEYIKRVFNAILSNAELETIEPGIGNLLVSQAKSVIVMKKANTNVLEEMQTMKQNLLDHLKKTYPIKSRIAAWIEEQTVAFQREFVQQNLWSAHENAISLCEAEDLQQTAYFLRRDLAFLKEREDILLKELGKVKVPNKEFMYKMRIWLPKNYVTHKSVVGEETITIPTVIAEDERAPTNRHEDVHYYVDRYYTRKSSTRYPLWRWSGYILQTWTWMWNSMFFFGIVFPWCSPVSFRALLFIRPFKPDKKISDADGKLYPDESSLTQTLISRVSAIWDSVRTSRKTFETTPDRGFLGKSLTRHFNRFWNYVIKGFFGSLLVVLSFPALCIALSSASVALAVLAPVWIPVVSVLIHLLSLITYDYFGSGVDNKICILLEVLILRFLIQGIMQPVSAVLFGFVVCPFAALGISIFGVLRRGLRLFWDTAIYSIVIKSRGRVPAHDGFVARRIAGPGLASNYCLQIRPEQALAALEANMESEELTLFKAGAIEMIEMPVKNYQSFVSQVFTPFSANLIEAGVYKNLLSETSNYKTDLINEVGTRQRRLNPGLDYTLQTKIKLPEKQLKLAIHQAAHMLEAFYPSHIFSQLTYSEEDFWEKKTLEFRDWTGLASQMLSEIFSPSFLVPLENTDTYFELKVEHINLGRYIRMLESANVHDDLDVVVEMHSGTGEVSTRPPQIDIVYFNPSENIMQAYHYYSTHRKFPWSAPELTNFDKLEVPLPIPHPAVIAISIFNRENELHHLIFEDYFCTTLIRAIMSFKEIAIANNAESVDFESSTPENGVEPVTVISHLAEQEKSFSDDSTDMPTSPMLGTGDGSDNTHVLEHKVDINVDYSIGHTRNRFTFTDCASIDIDV